MAPDQGGRLVPEPLSMPSCDPGPLGSRCNRLFSAPLGGAWPGVPRVDEIGWLRQVDCDRVLSSLELEQLLSTAEFHFSEHYPLVLFLEHTGTQPDLMPDAAYQSSKRGQVPG